MDGTLYAYGAPRSTAQEAYRQARLAQLAAQRRERRSSENPDHDLVERSMSESSVASLTLADSFYHRRDVSLDGKDGTLPNTPSSGSVRHDSDHHANLLKNPFELRHGRRYLRDIPYPFPCDLAEIQRQNLRTLLGCQVLGKPFCSPNVESNVPKKVLEIGCGGAFWTATCHQHFAALGHTDIAFTGLDVAPLAPDLRQQGINWTFVQHDMRRIPLPFDDQDFDLIMMKDTSAILPTGRPFQRFFDDVIRLLSEGGTLEVWESDYVLRALPRQLPASAMLPGPERSVAQQTATYVIAPGAPFLPAQSKYIQQANAWITEALDRRQLPPTPCAGIAQFLIQECELTSIGIRRVAIPLCVLHGERDGSMGDPAVAAPSPVGSPISPGAPSKTKLKPSRDRILTLDQMAIRKTALTSVLQMIDSMEPLLREASGKNSEEWTHWWASMTADLTDPSRGTLSGECLEFGAWWATKVADDG